MGLEPFADSVWIAATPIQFLGIWFPHVMTVIRLTSGRLMLHSPCRPSTVLVQAIANIGSVDYIVAPNWFHDLYLAEYRRLYPESTFWGPRLLKRQKPAIIDHLMEQDTQPPWSTEMPLFTLSGLLTFDESIFFHNASRTLIVADLLANVSVNAGTPFLTRTVYRLTSMDERLAMFPYLRWFGFTARKSLRAAAQRILKWNPERLIVGHGTPIAGNAAAQLGPILRTWA